MTGQAGAICFLVAGTSLKLASLCRYLTTNAAEKRRPAISQGETILKNGMAGASGLQPEKCSALQPEIVQAALRSSPEPFDSRISTQTSSPLVVSVFSEASQSQVNPYTVATDL